MLPYPFLKIICLACVVGIIGAPQNVHPKAHLSPPAVLILRQAQDGRLDVEEPVLSLSKNLPCPFDKLRVNPSKG